MRTKKIIDQDTYQRAAKLFDVARRAHQEFFKTQNRLIFDVLGLDQGNEGDWVYEAITEGNGTLKGALAKEGVAVKAPH